MLASSKVWDVLGFGIMCECEMNVRMRQNRTRRGKVAVWRHLTAARLVRSCNPTTSTPPLGSVPLVSWYNMHINMSKGKPMGIAYPPRPLAEPRSGRYAGCESAASEVFGCIPHGREALK